MLKPYTSHLQPSLTLSSECLQVQRVNKTDSIDPSATAPNNELKESGYQIFRPELARDEQI